MCRVHFLCSERLQSALPFIINNNLWFGETAAAGITHGRDQADLFGCVERCLVVALKTDKWPYYFSPRMDNALNSF